ncbi:MAG: PHP domain-containing protein [Candidatus Improbicoccus pseudotrichonymphae]|uniref:PHP domain-containing protein n=1 Tax=Candidatus Improbicoccus pseudotrichonymphae TaxID=3033792 RepID=A0AA48KWS8_9FIRM|nr:MAG: PHP domain-containing protein [Candidatus Improbicoccus pseudotrichonymphae]
MKIDLHCHTKLSDGSTSIDEFLFIAKQTNVEVVAVTDHDTFAGAIRAKVLSKNFGIDVVLGAEFSSTYEKENREIHILCYMCEFPERLEHICRQNSVARQKTMNVFIRNVMKNYPISPHFISLKAKESSNVFRNHIVQAIMDSGYMSGDYSSSLSKLLDDELIKGEISKPVFSSPENVIDTIHQAKGLAVLAHPKDGDEKALLPDLLKLGIDGVEVFYPEANKTLQEKLLDFTDENDLLVTGGSNFHGMYSTTIKPLGSFCTEEKHFRSMFNKKDKIFS